MDSKGYLENQQPYSMGAQQPPQYQTQPPPYYDQQQQQQQQQQNAGFQQPIMHQPQMVQTVFVGRPNLGPDPCGYKCHNCHQQIVTRLDYESSTKTHLMAGLLCAFVCWPCAWIPYVMDSCKNANHYCPNCNAFIGTYRN